jgi:hypothetical protein
MKLGNAILRVGGMLWDALTEGKIISRMLGEVRDKSLSFWSARGDIEGTLMGNVSCRSIS